MRCARLGGWKALAGSGKAVERMMKKIWTGKVSRMKILLGSAYKTFLCDPHGAYLT